MIERFSDPSSTDPEHISPQDIVVDFNMAKEIVIWLNQEGPGASIQENSAQRYKLNRILMRHMISPDDPDKFVKLREKAEKALDHLNKSKRKRRGW